MNVTMSFMFAAEQLSICFMMLYRYVIPYIVHPRHLSIVHTSSHLIHNQHCQQIVGLLCIDVFVATQTDVK